MTDWQPSASTANLIHRARLIQKLREWFSRHNILEVETPLMSCGATTDPQIESFKVGERHLRTSAEFHLKRLLAAGSPDIYELGKVFRVDECGRYHNPEFTMLEWYRLGLDHHQLITEIELLLQHLGGSSSITVERISYRDLWLKVADLDLASAGNQQIADFIEASGVVVPQSIVDSQNDLLDLAMGTVIAESLPANQYTCIIDYPACQASLAKVDSSNPHWPVANRFEIYFGTVELANGFYELTDAAEQQQRFEADNLARDQNNQVQRPIDTHFISALEHGLPRCAGVAIGVDRLMMALIPDIQSLDQVMSFAWHRA